MRSWFSRLGWRFWSLCAACALLGGSLLKPTVPWPEAVYRYLFVIDITQSMNARDYHVTGLPADRLGFVKASLQHALEELPCGSEVGLGLFTTQHSQVLFDPIEICTHQALIDDIIAHIDWRMAWAADSHIAHGVFTALRELTEADRTVRLVFFSDGEQFPPQAAAVPFYGKPGEVSGLIIGVGGASPVPIPRYDRENKSIGYWQYADLEDWLPPSELAGRPRHDSSPYLSHLDEPNLKALAATTGLRYHRLTTPAALIETLLDANLAERRIVALDARPALSLAAGVLLVMPMLVGLLNRRH